MAHIEAREISVQFPIYSTSTRSLKKAVLSATTGGRIAADSHSRVTVTALDGITFRLNGGDRVGVVGHNGSGKTTLLRVLAGAYEPVCGSVVIEGRVASLLDLSIGMDLEGTGYENILIRGILMGFKPMEIRLRWTKSPNSPSSVNISTCRCVRTPPACSSASHSLWPPACAPI
jgi:lipopolysaccharide transport system ATP-binding protein